MKELLINPYSFDAGKVERDRHGRATVKAKVMKVGRLKYKMPDGSVVYGNITREGLDKAAKTAGLKPITVRHPPKLVDSKDVMNYMEGVSADDFKVEDIEGEEWLTGTYILQTEKAINTAEAGDLGVSPGYFRFEDGKPVIKNGEMVFTPDINHHAIGCRNPRASGASISLDDEALISLDEAEDDSAWIYSFAKAAKPKKKEVIMKRVLNAVKVEGFSLDEAPIEYDEAGTGTEQAIAKFQERETKTVAHMSKMQESMDEVEETHKTELGTATGENKALKKQVADLEEAQKTMISMDDLDSKVGELAEVKEQAVFHKVKEKFSTPFGGKKLVVAAVFPDESFDDSEIEGAYKTIKGNSKDSAEMRKSQEALRKAGNLSMDSGDKVSFSQIDIQAIKKYKDNTKKRSA